MCARLQHGATGRHGLPLRTADPYPNDITREQPDQDEDSGEFGGAMLGSQVGDGSGRAIATAAGAIGGSVAGKSIADNVDQIDAYEIEVRRDAGDSLIVVQKADTAFSVGQRVRLVGYGANLSVAPY